MNIQQIMKQAQQIQKKMSEMQEKLKETTREGQSGGGLVKATVNGKGDFLKLDIATELLKPEEKTILEDLIIAAFNDAKSKVEGDFSTQMNAMAADMGLPEGFNLPQGDA
jgi:nucleoid-associated protein EbfC